MKHIPSLLATLLLAGTGWASCALAAAPTGPEITAQGFRMDVEQAGELGRFQRIRVRVEAPERIEELHIKERSYEVDLASTPERAHLPLFGLEKRPRSRRDVTLNFQQYINARIDDRGRYSIHIRVVDAERQSAEAVLLIRVAREAGAQIREPVETSRFTFQRIGAGDVVGTGDLGITWKTVESDLVTIQLTRAGSGAGKLVDLALSDFQSIETKTQLNQRLADAEGAGQIVFSTANGRAADTVFAVVTRDVPYILRIETSETHLSQLGTTVTLNGTIKH